MSEVWATILALCAGTALAKAGGALATGGRDRHPHPRALAVTRLVAPAILAGLVVYETINGHDGGISIDARAVGLAAAAGAVALRAPITVVVVVAAAATALTRLIF